MESQEKSAQRRAVAIGEACSLSAPARRLLNARQSAGEFQALLRQHRLHDDAVRFQAHLLPKREAVWWGCLCAWQVYRPEPPETELKALQATVRWVNEPDEDKRQTLEAEKDRAGMGTPAGALAAAAFLSGGSLAPAGLPQLAAAPALTAKLVSVAVLLAATKVPSIQREETLSHFLELTHAIGEGRLSWRPEPRVTA